MNSPLLNYKNRIVNPANPINWEHSLNRGLVGCWMVPPNSGFRGAQTFWDLTRGGRSPNNGTLTNGPTWTGPAGRPGGYGALSFDGLTSTDDVVTVGGSLGSGYSALTCAVWGRRDRIGSDGPLTLGTSSGTTRAMIYFGTGASNPAIFRVYNSGGSSADATGTSDATQSGWHHFVGTYDGTTIRIYVDGVAEGSAALSGAVRTDSANTEIGRYWSTAQTWGGPLDDVRVYNRALSADEVRVLYNQSRRGHPDTFQWISTRAAFSAGAAPPATPGVFNAAWWMVPNKNIGICRAV